MENPVENSQTPEHSNIKLIYSYTEYKLKLANDSLNALNTKLGSLIAFSGAAIGFSINLPNKAFLPSSADEYVCYLCLILKILVCLFLVFAISIGVTGFYPKAGGGMTPPQLLMQENYYDTDEDCRLIIVRTWIEALTELEAMRDAKAGFVKKSIFALAGAAVLAATDIILASFLSMF